MSSLDVMALILAGGQVPELKVLTAQRAKAAVPFGGLYRVIDFPLSNLMHSDIGVTGVLSQYHPQSLIDHLADGSTWDFVGRNKALKMLPPYWGRENQQWYNGTADALWQNIDFIEEYDPELVLILSGDHIYRMDYRPLIEYHRSKNADITMVFKKAPMEVAHRFGIGVMDSDGRVTNYEEKPDNPKSNLASLTIYVCNKEVLVNQLVSRRPPADERYHIYRTILPYITESHRIYGYVFDDYWHYSRSLDSYFEAHRDLVGPDPKCELYKWPVETNLNDDGIGEMPPAMFLAGSNVKNSLVGPGCRISGTVINSVIAPGVVIEAGAEVVDAVVNHRTVIKANARVKWTIADKDVCIGANARVIGDPEARPNMASPESLRCGVAVLGKRAQVPDGAEIGGNVIVAPGVTTPMSVEAGENVGTVKATLAK